MKGIILAGESEKDVLEFGTGKALVEFCGKPMILYIIDALTEAHKVDEIIIIGDVQRMNSLIGNKVTTVIPSSGDLFQNFLKGMDYFQGEEKVLLATCDIPFIRAECVDHFIEESLKSLVDISYPIISKEVCLEAYPEARRTYVELKEGIFTGGNLLVVSPKKMQTIGDQIQFLINHRKDPLKMLRILGPTLIFKYISKQLKIQHIEKYLKSHFSILGGVVVTPYPQIATDIDQIKEVKILEKYMKR